MLPQASQRLDRLPPYVFVSIAAKIDRLTRAGHNVLRLDIGNPDMPPPEHVIEQLAKAAHTPDMHGYSGYRGTAAFRQAVASHYQRRFGVALDPEYEVLPLLGSKEGIVNLATAYLDPGDTVLVPEIGYPSYKMAALLVGADICFVQMDHEDNYKLRLDQIPQNSIESAKILWVNYPNNPTGGVIDTTEYQRIVDFCRANDILLASDNPYVEVVYDGHRAPSALEALGAIDCTVEFMSFSKTYNMAGWRLGAAVGHRDALARLLHIKSNMDSGHFKAIYAAGIAAMESTTTEWIHARNKVYARRRDLILANLNEIGLVASHVPLGAMYIWATPTSLSAEEYVDLALENAHVSLAPGGAYGPGGKDYIRLSVGVEDATIEEALQHLRDWYTNLEAR